jgi:hypothetical protein
VCSLAAFAFLQIGCSSSPYEGAPRYPLTGKVVVDGHPMGSGVISFLPQEKEGRVSGGRIANGLYAVEEEKGANAGKYRVEIHWNKPTGRKIKHPMDPTELIDEMKGDLPDRYHKNSELTADVTAEQTTFDFDLKLN